MMHAGGGKWAGGGKGAISFPFLLTLTERSILILFLFLLVLQCTLGENGREGDTEKEGYSIFWQTRMCQI